MTIPRPESSHAQLPHSTRIVGPSDAPAAGRETEARNLLEDTAGLTGVEYTLALALICVVGFAAWGRFGEAVADRGGEVAVSFRELDGTAGAGSLAGTAGGIGGLGLGGTTDSRWATGGNTAALGPPGLGGVAGALAATAPQVPPGNDADDWWARTKNEADRFVRGAVEGDLATEDNGWSGVAGQVLTGFIPFVGQAADVRDFKAAWDSWQAGQPGGGVDLIAASIGFVPGLGDGVKAAIKGTKRAAKAGVRKVTQGLSPGDGVLVTRSDGSVSAGRVLGEADGNVLVEVQTPTGPGTKVVAADDLVRRADVGDTVYVRRSDGSETRTEVMLQHPDGTVSVGWTENGQDFHKTVPETELRRADPADVRRGPHDPVVTVDDGYVHDRIFMDSITHDIPSEGWKLHVSADISNPGPVADRVLPVLRELNVNHKVVGTQANYEAMLGGQGGKYITIYPDNDAHAAEIARRIDAALGDLRGSGPVIQGERALGSSGMVFGRYGGFTKTTVRNADGVEVPDVRGQVSPPWVDDPFGEL